MCRRALLLGLLAAALMAFAGPITNAARLGAGQAPPTALASKPAKLDRDGDKVFDDLETLLAGKPGSDELRVVVTLRAPASLGRIRGLERAAGSFQVRRRFSIIDGFAATVRVQQVRSLAASPLVDHVEEDSVVRVLNDAAQSSFGVTKARLDAPQIEGDADGNPAGYSSNDLVAAVIDTGIDRGHLDLDEGKVIGFRDFVNGETAAYDDEGHGTHVSAALAGDGDARADRLYKGVAPGAALVGIKVLDRFGNGSESDVIAGIDWAVQNKSTYGIEALNLSLGIPGCSDGADAASLAVNNASDAALVVAVAAGNEGPGTCTVGSPGAAANALTVGAMADLASNGFYQADFSSRGKTADGRIKPDVSAPGVNITSAQSGTTNGYVSFDGTSAATPFTAGVALLMLDATGTLTSQQVKDRMTQTAIDWGRGGDNRTPGSSGTDIDYGAGRLDAYAAIRAAGAHISNPPAAPQHELREGTLPATGARVDYPIEVTDTRFPLAATLILSGLSAGSARNPDFDLYLFDPNGQEVAHSFRTLRQEDLGYNPTARGTYTLRVTSFRGSGPYFVDISRPKPIPYPHPIGASPIRVTFVPAFEGCEAGSANSTHGQPLNFRSCNPPDPASSTARFGPQSIGFAHLLVCNVGATAANCGQPGLIKPDLRLFSNLRDVQCRVTGTPGTCIAGGDYNPNGAPGAYTSSCGSAASCNGPGKAEPFCAPDTDPSGGTSEANCIAGTDLTQIARIPGASVGATGTQFEGSGVRITDTYNGTAQDAAATVVDIGFPIPMDCLADLNVGGSTCGVNTSANALYPSVVRDGDAAVWELGEIQVTDSGPDGVRGNSGDELLAVQGVLVP